MITAATDFERSILIVEDNTLLRTLLAENLTTAGFQVAAAGSAAEGRKLARDLDPDIALLDVDLGDGPSGFHLAEALRKANPGLAIVFLTNIPEPRIAGEPGDPVPAGAAYLRKDGIADIDSLIETINRVSRHKAAKVDRHDKFSNHQLSKLSNSQISALRLVALGHTNAHIAVIRGTTERAVRNLLHRTFASLGIEDAGETHARVAAVRRFIDAAGKPSNLLPPISNARRRKTANHAVKS
jgi:DNA-binding NarL/FixJ family response regulator